MLCFAVNYRGSTGFGARSIFSLPGNIGSNDVQDMMTAIAAVTTHHIHNESRAIDRSRMAVVGGSHGGFLAGHLIGQYPDTFKAAVLRNPVTNIPAMVSVSDIPGY